MSDVKYARPEVKPEWVTSAMRESRKHAHESTSKMLNVIAALMVENARLVAEVNEHRAARGFEALEVHSV